MSQKKSDLARRIHQYQTQFKKLDRQQKSSLIIVMTLGVFAVVLGLAVQFFRGDLRQQAAGEPVIREISLTQIGTIAKADLVWQRGRAPRLRGNFPAKKGSFKRSYIGVFENIANTSYTGFRFGGLRAALRDNNVIRAEIELYPDRNQTNQIQIEVYGENSATPQAFTQVDLPSQRNLSNSGVVAHTISDAWSANTPVSLDVSQAFLAGVKNANDQDVVSLIFKGIGNRKQQRSFHNEFGPNGRAPRLKLTIRPKSGGATSTQYFSLASKSEVVSSVANEEWNKKNKIRFLQTKPKGKLSSTYIGTRTVPNRTYTGFHFSGDLSIPAGYRLESAMLEVVSSRNKQNDKKTFNVELYSDQNLQAPLFSESELMSSRQLSPLSVVATPETFSPQGVWSKNQKYSINITNLVNQHIVRGGNSSIALIARGISNPKNKNRLFFNGDGNPDMAPKLILRFVSQNSATATPPAVTNPPAATATPASGNGNGQADKTLKVVEVKYFPNANERAELESRSNQQSNQMKSLYTEMSKPKGFRNANAKPYLNVDVVKTIVRTGQSPNTNPNSNDANDYDRNYRSLNAMLTANNNEICNLIRNQGVDQVWYYSDVIKSGNDTTYDNGGFKLENWINYSNLLKRNQPAPYTSMCGGDNTFSVLSINMNQQTEMNAHGLIHAIEDYFPNFQTSELFWERFVGKPVPGNYNALANNCGDAHFPPNGSMADGLGYDYTNQSNVSTRCENWNPNGGGQATTINCSRWGCTERGYNIWWGQNLPNKNNGLTYQNKKIPNWWDFVVDVDENVSFYAKNSEEWFMNMEWVSENSDPQLSMPAFIDNVTTAVRDGQGSVSWQHQSSGQNRLLVVAVGYGSQGTGGVSSITMNSGGQTLNFVKAREDKFPDAKNTEIWYLTNQPQNGSITVNMTGNHDVTAAAISLAGVNQSQPIQLPGVGGGTATPGGSAGNFSRQLTIPSRNGDIAIAAFSTYTDGNTTSATGTTLPLVNIFPHNTNLFVTVSQSNSNSTNLTWSTTRNWFWASSGISIRKQ